MPPARVSTRRSTVAPEKHQVAETADTNGALPNSPESHQSSPGVKKRQMSVTKSVDKMPTSKDHHPIRRELPKKGRTKAEASPAIVNSSKVPPKEESPAKRQKRIAGVPIDELGEMAGFFDDQSKIIFQLFSPSINIFSFHQVYEPRSSCLQKLAWKGFSS